MGRKIPGKKHKGIKDPLKQREKRLAQLETKINEPPKNVDEQVLPKSLERVIKLKEAVKSGRICNTKKKQKSSKSGVICVGMQNAKLIHPKAKPDKVVPIFQQRPGEDGDNFYRRVCRETSAFLNETAFEKKYNVQVDRNPQTGKIEGLSKRARDELDELEKLRAKHKNIKKKKNIKNRDEIKLTKAQKKKQKLEMKKKKVQEERLDEFGLLNDRVKFGEVVHAPPQLTVKPRKADSAISNKPGRKNLLLNSLLEKNGVTKDVSLKSTTVSRSGKRKKLPVGERRQLEKQQQNVIAAYRRLRAQRSTDITT